MSSEIRSKAPVDVMASRLRQITLGNGYRHNVGDDVYRGGVFLEPKTELPAVSILEAEDEPTTAEVTANQILETTSYQVMAIARCDELHPLDVGHELLADIKAALFQAPTVEFERLDGTAHSVEYTGRSIQAGVEQTGFVYVTLNVDITHPEKLGKPEEVP